MAYKKYNEIQKYAESVVGNELVKNLLASESVYTQLPCGAVFEVSKKEALYGLASPHGGKKLKVEFQEIGSGLTICFIS